VWQLILNLLYFTIPLSEYLFLYHADVGECFRLFIYYQPCVLVLVIPIGFLTAVLTVYGRFSGDREFLAMQTCGLHAGSLLAPLAAFSFIASLLLVVFMDVILPWGNTSFIKLDYQIRLEHSAIAVKERDFITEFTGYQVYVDQKEEGTGKLKNVTVWMLDEKGYPYRILHSAEGSLIQDPKYHIILRLGQGIMQQVGNRIVPGFSNLLQLKYANCDLDLTSKRPPLGPLVVNSPRNMNIHELAEQIQAEKSKKKDTRFDEVEFHKKFSLPFATLAFAFIGVPLGLMTRAGSYLGTILALALIAAYDGFLMLGDNGGFLGQFSPFLAMWVPNFFLLVVGAIMMFWLDFRLWFIFTLSNLWGGKSYPMDEKS
jgi:lipopolysaccharide export LptBFGC system permease protein LptF